VRFGIPLAVALMLLLPVSAFAAGTVRIVQSDGSAQTYIGVIMKVQNQTTLAISSADGQSTMTLAVKASDCAPANGIVYCWAGQMAFQNNGKSYTIPFKSAKFYLNQTDQEQPSDPLAAVLAAAGCQVVSKVAPHSVVFAVLTKRGTHITGNGTLN